MRLFDAVQATWNLLEPSAGPALAAAHAAGMGVIVKEALANGRLVLDADGPGTGHTRALDALDALDRIAATRISGRGSSGRPGRDAVAIAAVLAQPWADLVLSGAVTPQQVRSNLDALDLEVAADEVDLLTAFAIPAETYWRERSALAWS